MSYVLLKSLHVLTALALFLSFGAIFIAGDPKRAKPAMMVHGIAILLLVAIGLHLVFSQKMTGGWWHAKIVLAVLLGVAPLFVRRQWLSPLAASAVCLLLGGGAAYLAIAKPF